MKREPFFSEEFLHRLERLALIARRSTVGQLQGERRSPKRGQSVEFADFRPYVSGDDFRRIDWNAYARLEKFFIKLFVEEEDLTVHFLLDNSRSMNWGQPNKLWYAAQVVGALGYVALAGLDRITISAMDHTASNGNGNHAYFPPQRGKRQALALFDYLQGLLETSGQTLEVPRKPERSPAQWLRAYASSALHKGPLLLVSDLMDDGWQDGLGVLAGRGFEVNVVHILSPQEVNPELEGDLKLLDSENAGEVEITADYELLERYRRELQAWQENWKRFCAPRGIHYAPVETSLPLDELLFAWLRRQGVLK